MISDNPIVDTDSYKVSHWLQYPPGTVNVFSYLESRGGQYKSTVFFGLQYLLKRYLSQTVTVAHVEEAREFLNKHGLPFNYEGWMYVATKLHGKLPLRIKALPEGTVTPTGIPLLTAEATDPRCFWIVGWFETQVMRLWYPITVASLSFDVKRIIKSYLELSGDVSGLPFKLHDFGSRGVSSQESAGIGGAAHLINFMGSDTLAGVAMLRDYYGADMAGYSIPAAEHSTITSWGREHEADAYANMLKQFAKPGSIVAVVSDSYDLWNAVDGLWGGTLRQAVIDSGATVVIRPDSGDPVFVVNKLCHDLDRKFGSTINAKGYKALNHVRIIQGDGVNPYTIDRILKSVTSAGFSADNVAFGMGGALLQQVNRDTQRFAFKCSSVSIANATDLDEFLRGDREDLKAEFRDVFKDPVTDPGKQSKKGRIGAKLENGTWSVCQDLDPENKLQAVFSNGYIVRTTTLDEIRSLAK